MNIRSGIYIFIFALIVFLSDSAYAGDFKEQKKQADSGSSKVYESFVKAKSDAYTVNDPVDSGAVEDYNDLIEAARNASARNPIESILKIHPVSTLEQIGQFMDMTDYEISEYLKAGASEADILGILIARSPKIASAEESWRAALQLYPQTLYLQDLVGRFHTFTEGMALGIGKEYQRGMIQMHFPLPGMLSLR